MSVCSRLRELCEKTTPVHPAATDRSEGVAWVGRQVGGWKGKMGGQGGRLGGWGRYFLFRVRSLAKLFGLNLHAAIHSMTALAIGQKWSCYTGVKEKTPCSIHLARFELTTFSVLG